MVMNLYLASNSIKTSNLSSSFPKFPQDIYIQKILSVENDANYGKGKFVPNAQNVIV